MSAADRVAVHDLLVGYFCGFDERRTNNAFLRETFIARRGTLSVRDETNAHRMS